jgi:superoxide reductase
MKENVKFHICEICGNQVGLIHDVGNPIVCCGKKMTLMEANTTDASHEKHVPTYEKVEDEIVVRVGEIEHPMQKEHYIMWIALVSDNKTTRITLYPEQETTVRFKYAPKSTIYAYCNIHGLWKKEVE